MKPTKKSVAAIRRVPARARDLDLSVERDRDGRQLGDGVGVSDAAADGAAVADRRMADQAERLEQERRPLGDERRALGSALAHGRADAQAGAVGGNLRELGEARDVDHDLGRREPEVEDRHEALTAREHRAVSRMARAQRERLGERRRREVAERGGLHQRISNPPLTS